MEAPARLSELKPRPPGWSRRFEFDSPLAVERLSRQWPHLVVRVEVVSKAEVFEVNRGKGT